ncbi:MAG: GNAT family N-acetyltransferase [Firmicutes bacterium]|nr:GNAT family N-acetyltransferase [Bacillota bacterium]
MIFSKEIRLKDGRSCTIRNATAEDAREVLADFILTHSETDYLSSYPDEINITVEKEAEFLRARTESPDEAELIAVVDGNVVGCAGIDRIGRHYKMSHRANFGISIEKAYWGLGIGRALTESCIECAKNAGYTQVELEAVADNGHALNLYESVGFVEFGRNPRGFRSRIAGYNELVYMRLELGE